MRWKSLPAPFEHYRIYENGKVVNTRYKRNGCYRELKSILNKNGYWYIVASNNKQRKAFFIHRLMYTTFVGDIPDGFQINHRNDKSDDNRIENLELVSQKKNLEYRWKKRHKIE